MHYFKDLGMNSEREVCERAHTLFSFFVPFLASHHFNPVP